ncbi:MAG: hypothetical protein KC897_00475 [Candidatus Omnitrophica bacterium]|nr:hypothetical protein [Candidatus Omnitrophota bacterium]MCB9721519.1 hypothetical protein [Candidatus Omnitrophota bacterium]
MTVVRLLIALGFPVILGLALMRRLHADRLLSTGARIPCAFALGMGMVSHWMLLMTIAGVGYSMVSLHVPLAVIAAALWLTAGGNHADTPSPPHDTPAGGWRTAALVLICAFIIYMTVFIGVRALMVPIMEWDAISWIALKAKILFYENGAIPIAKLPNSAYPLQVPLSLAWIAFHLGEWSETLIKVLFPVYYLLFALFLYSTARLYVDRLWAAVCTALFLSVLFAPYHATIAYRDTVMMNYFCGGMLVLVHWLKNTRSPLLWIAAILLGLGSFVKLEGALYMGLGLMILAAAVLLYGPRERFAKIRVTGISGAISAGIFAIYFIYKNLIGATHATQDTAVHSAGGIGSRLWEVLTAVCRELFLSGNWHILWALFALSIWLPADRSRQAARLVTAVTVIAFITVYIGLGTLTGIYKSILGLGSSGVLPRIFIHVYPLAVLSICLAAAERPDCVGAGHPQQEGNVDER